MKSTILKYTNIFIITTVLAASFYLYFSGLPKNFALVHCESTEDNQASTTEGALYGIGTEKVKYYKKIPLTSALSQIYEEDKLYSVLLKLIASGITYLIGYLAWIIYAKERKSSKAFQKAKELETSATLKLERIYDISEIYKIDKSYFKQ